MFTNCCFNTNILNLLQYWRNGLLTRSLVATSWEHQRLYPKKQR
jgi:hypothetical protein